MVLRAIRPSNIRYLLRFFRYFLELVLVIACSPLPVYNQSSSAVHTGDVLPAGGSFQGSPEATLDSSANLFVAFSKAVEDNSTAMLLAKSTNQGATFHPPTMA